MELDLVITKVSYDVINEFENSLDYGILDKIIIANENEKFHIELWVIKEAA